MSPAFQYLILVFNTVDLVNLSFLQNKYYDQLIFLMLMLVQITLQPLSSIFFPNTANHLFTCLLLFFQNKSCQITPFTSVVYLGTKVPEEKLRSELEPYPQNKEQVLLMPKRSTFRYIDLAINQYPRSTLVN